MTEGLITKALSGFYYVESVGEVIECKARGLFRLEKNTPLVGDHVEFFTTEQGRGIITAILPRKNSFIRPAVANIDKIVIVASGAIPVTDPFLIDRMTAIAHKKNCEPIICINKLDLDPANELFDIYVNAGYNTIRTSAETGEGLDELLNSIKGGISAFCGNSGVGKSSILNQLDSYFNIAVGEVSKKLGRGRHTTRHVELYKLAGNAVVADTPGFSSFDTDQLTSKEEIASLFPDFSDYIDNCRFIDCAHIKELGCAVLEALQARKLQKTRHDSYIRLYEQAKKYKKWEHKKKDV
jgi:ribosome biogenesis GTPase